MKFDIGDRVCWQPSAEGILWSAGRGTVTDMDRALEKVEVKWDDGVFGWCYMDEVEHVDVITRLGEVADVQDG